MAIDEVVEAALFVANRTMRYDELAHIARADVKEVEAALERLAARLNASGSALRIVYGDGAARLELRPDLVPTVAQLTKVALSRKAAKILALIAKKKEMLQSDLRKYFRGEIYSYVKELREAGYVSAERWHTTRRLRPTKLFYDSFQLGERL